ncbi:MAG: calcium-translocating P-type ATPase, PMCA-type [Christensenellales bacterium]|jgi:Ca2+-transporting ATPase|nr:calcium-translocating P-type ATPase, PMCA-type [Clostridiales bacterium]
MKNYYNLSPEEVLKELNTSEKGLNGEEAKRRLEKYGKNELKEAAKKSFLARFLNQMKDVMIIVLLVAAAVSAAIAIARKEYSELIDSGIILLIVLINAFIGLAQESKAEAALEALKNMNKPLAKVLRDGEIVKINSSEIVVGDIVMLEAGDTVPADMRLISSASLKIEEAALTGESVPSEKDTATLDKEDAPLGDRHNMAYSSGAVAYGRGQGVVVATGMNTEVGKIAEMLSKSEEQQTPLQQQLAKTAKILSVIVLIAAAIIFAVAVIKARSFALDVIIGSFMTAVAIAVAAIPEGLPAVVTIVLAIGVQRMSERKAIIRNLPAVETLGCCQIICSDKTGTLTLNQMTVKELFTFKKGIIAEGEKTEDKAFDNLIKGMTLCNDTVINEDKLLGDPTETALVAYAQKIGVDVVELNKLNKRIDEIPFDSKRKLMSTINQNAEKTTAFIKGAPDILIGKCKYIQDDDKIREITDKDIEIINQANNAMAKKALRVLAVAVKHEDLNIENLESDMVFVGLVGMIDPPRPEVAEAVRVCKKAGMTAIMITGDHIDTASAIAKEIGILDKDDYLVITGQQLDKLSDEEFMANLERYRVFARVSPENKVRIVKAFKSKGYVVAMTGDGVNDAPSIKQADIGIGMGITGTDVSKGASDMVLADDNFATIINAVEEGRKVYANIKKAIQFLLSANIAEVLCLFAVTLFMPADVHFLTPVMILWVNLVTDSLPALSLGMEKAEADVMDQKPRQAGASLFAGQTGKDIIIQGLFQTALVLGSFFVGYYVLEPAMNFDDRLPMTMAFVTLCVIQLLHAYNLRSQTKSLFKGNPFSNKFLNLSFIVGIALLALVIVFPFMQNAFGTVLLPIGPLAVSVGFAAMIIPLVELQKAVETALQDKKEKV